MFYIDCTAEIKYTCKYKFSSFVLLMERFIENKITGNVWPRILKIYYRFFLYKNNFIGTTRLKFAQKSRTS